MRILILFILSISNLLTCSLGDSVTQSLGDSEHQSHLSQISLADSLYKNYLPQHNFEEVKAAVEFFELEIEDFDFDNDTDSDNDFDNDNDNKLLIPNSSFLIYNCARAHYYHAVGLMERDDIVGACEHYLRALELMETEPSFQVLSNLDYDKTRFIALIYTRLGRLFLNENYCDLAIINYRKGLEYVEMIGDISSKANLLKFLGNAYQLSGEADSALYYYNESLRSDSGLYHKLDVEKSIAKILFDKGEKDSAYALIKSNMDKMENYSARDSYYLALGEMYYKDKVYDSAIIYLKLSIKGFNSNIILASSNCLSKIYELYGNFDSKNYYDSISILYFSKNSNRSVEVTKIHNLYDNYIKRKESFADTKKKEIYKYYSLIALSIIVCIVFITIIRFRDYRARILEKENEIDTKDRHLKEITDTNKDLLNQNKKLKKPSPERRKTINNNIKSYRNAVTSRKILSDIDYIKENNLKTNNLVPLTTEELMLLLDDANIHLDDFIQRISNKYPKLKREDLYCICLLLLDISEPAIAALLGKSYNTIWSRINKIRSIIGVKSNMNIHDIIL